jgi:Ion channel
VVDRREAYKQQRRQQQQRGTIGDHHRNNRNNSGAGSSSFVAHPSNEIAQFSQFALGTAGNDSFTNRTYRRTRERSYRSRRKHMQSGTLDSTSPASSENQYESFFQPPPLPQPPSLPPHAASHTAYLKPRTRGYSSPTLSGYLHSPANSTGSSRLPRRKVFPGPPVQTSLLPPTYYGSYDSSGASPPPPVSVPEHVPKQFSVSSPYHHQRSGSETPTGGSFDMSASRARTGSDQSGGPRRSPSMPVGPSVNASFPFKLPDRSSPIFSSQRGLRPHSSPLFHSERAGRLDRAPRNDYADHFRMPSPPLGGVGGQGFGIARFSPHPHQPSPQRRDPPREDHSFESSDASSDGSDENQSSIHVLRESRNRHLPDHSPPSSSNQRSPGPKFDRRQFLPQTSRIDDREEVNYPTYICPVCKTRQREFFTVSSAPRHVGSAWGYIALYSTIYVVASLYIFGLQEGWSRLDCIYFAVITLTTAGLGDFVPTTDGAKIVCSIYIYFGVACIGLLLGSYIAGMLDERSHREALANQIKSCPNCAWIQNVKDASERRRKGVSPTNNTRNRATPMSGRVAVSCHTDGAAAGDQVEGRASKKIRRTETPLSGASEQFSTSHSTKLDEITTPETTLKKLDEPMTSFTESPSVQKSLLGSPMTSQILGRQSHTRHMSMDIRNSSSANISRVNSLGLNGSSSSRRTRNFSMEIPATVEEGVQSNHDTAYHANSVDEGAPPPPPPLPGSTNGSSHTKSDDYSTASSESDESLSIADELEGKTGGVRNAKYVFLTLRDALINSMVIIAFGCTGFYLIEGFTFIDSWYFTTVLLTTVGYGDIVPVTHGGKLFATIYLMVAGTILLNNMSLISMIPLELRKRRTEQAVLTQFGDSLDDDALRELATGPVIQRINLASKDSHGLAECTREMFSLAMLIRLGKVSEQDVKLTFAAFQRLDVGNEGVLNSKSIIGGMIQKSRASHLNLCRLGNSSRTSRHRRRRANRHQAEQPEDSTRSGYSDSIESSNLNSGVSWRSIGSWIYPVAPDPRFASVASSITAPSIGFPSDRASANSERAPLMLGSQAAVSYGQVEYVPTRTE